MAGRPGPGRWARPQASPWPAHGNRCLRRPRTRECSRRRSPAVLGVEQVERLGDVRDVYPEPERACPLPEWTTLRPCPQPCPGELVDGLAEPYVPLGSQPLGGSGDVRVEIYGRPHASTVASLMHTCAHQLCG